MTSHPVLRVPASLLREEVRRLQTELEVTPAFPAEVEEAAARAAQAPRLPELDRTDLPFVTIDPAGAQDLDQALHIARDGDGWVVHYAIADVAAFVSPGDPVDVEANRRGETLYGAEEKVPLHPPAISEDAASLLPDRVRPALLWTIRLGPDGERVDADVRRALVRSREQLTYEEAQRRVDAGEGPETLAGSRRSGRCAWPARPHAGACRCRSPSRTWSWMAGAGTSSTGPGCRSRTGTRRSRCSPATPPPR